MKYDINCHPFKIHGGKIYKKCWTNPRNGSIKGSTQKVSNIRETADIIK